MELFTATGKLKKVFQFFCGCEKFHWSFGFLVINVCNHGEHYETPCISHQRTSAADFD